MYGMRIPGLVELAAGPWEAALLPAFGMNTAALSFYGKPILRAPHSLRALEEDPFAYGAPLLINSGGDGAFPGEFCRRPFALLEHTGHSVLAVYENGDADGPCLFSVEVRYALGRSGFRQTFTVKNTGGSLMPLVFGLCTTFLEQSRFRVDIGQRLALDEQLCPTGAPIPLQGEEQSIPLGASSQGKAIRGIYTAAGHTARVGDILYTVSGNFDRWLLWNGDGRQGFCTIGPIQGFGGGSFALEPGDCAVFETFFRYADSAAGGCPYSLYINDGSQRGTSGPASGGKHYRRCPPPAGSRTYL